MGIRLRDGTKARTFKAPMTVSEALLANTAYVITNNFATKAAATVAPAGISLGQAQAAVATAKRYDFIAVDQSTLFEADVEDANDDCFYQTPSASGSSTTLIDTTNRTEAGTTFVGGEVAIHGIPEDGKNYSLRTITASTSSDGKITWSPAVLDQAGNAVTVGTSHRYSIVTYGQGDTTVRLNTDIDGLFAEPTLAGGKVKIAGPTDFTRASEGRVIVPIKFDV